MDYENLTDQEFINAAEYGGYGTKNQARIFVNEKQKKSYCYQDLVDLYHRFDAWISDYSNMYDSEKEKW